MLIVGELINASRKSVAEAIEKQDEEAIRQLAKAQADSGAHYIDVNAGIFMDKEEEYLMWLVDQVKAVTDIPCCIDSPNAKAIDAALQVHGGTAMINSISLEKERYDAVLSLVAGTELKIVALCTSDEGMPKTLDDRMKVADKLVNGLLQSKVPPDNIFVDLLVQPISTDDQHGEEFLKSIGEVMCRFEGIHTICGLSNISFGLPKRKLVNQAFVVMAIANGLDAAVVDPLDHRLMANILAAEAIRGEDRYCMNYLKAYRAKKFDFA